MRPLLSRPYLLSTDPVLTTRRALLFGAFVFIFLWSFEPFGLSFLGPRVAMVAVGYGAVCTGVMLLLNVAVPRVMSGWFMEEKWTVGRELCWTLVNVGLIGLGNALYTAAIGLAPWTWGTIGNFTLYTLLVGSFPVIVSVLLTESRLNRIHTERSTRINTALEARTHGKLPPTAGGPERITIPSETQDGGLELNADALCFVRSADNYVEVHHRDAKGLQRTVVRTSLKAVAETLAGNDRFMRCHKQHLVDLSKVVRVSGNAQGLKLHLEGTDEAIPVSRQLTTEVRTRLAVRP